MAQISKQASERFYLEVMRYLRGEPHEIGPTTIGMIKEIVEKDPTLLLPSNKDKLLSEIYVYDSEHTVKVTLSPEEIAAAVLSVTHEDDLPRA
jgi:hypothetical protein